jgi:hypothetical protein
MNAKVMKVLLTLTLLIVSYTIFSVSAQEDGMLEEQLDSLLKSLSTGEYFLSIDGEIVSKDTFIPNEPQYPVYYSPTLDSERELNILYDGYLGTNGEEKLRGRVSLVLSWYMEERIYIDIAGDDIPLFSEDGDEYPGLSRVLCKWIFCHKN